MEPALIETASSAVVMLIEFSAIAVFVIVVISKASVKEKIILGLFIIILLFENNIISVPVAIDRH